MKPGIRNMPVASSSKSASLGGRPGCSGRPGVPALRMAAIRLPSTTMSIGPIGGAPVPSIIVTPRMTNFLYGPRPSSDRRFGAGRRHILRALLGAHRLDAGRRDGGNGRRNGKRAARAVSHNRMGQSPIGAVCRFILDPRSAAEGTAGSGIRLRRVVISSNHRFSARCRVVPRHGGLFRARFRLLGRDAFAAGRRPAPRSLGRFSVPAAPALELFFTAASTDERPAQRGARTDREAVARRLHRHVCRPRPPDAASAAADDRNGYRRRVRRRPRRDPPDGHDRRASTTSRHPSAASRSSAGGSRGFSKIRRASASATIWRWREWMWNRPYDPHPDTPRSRRAVRARRSAHAALLPAGRALIRLDEIDWGGVRVNGIPPLDHPAVVSATAASYLRDGDLVFGVAVNGEPRAYPKRILAWHEMARDRHRRRRDDHRLLHPMRDGDPIRERRWRT